jgi:hypothetical protein
MPHFYIIFITVFFALSVYADRDYYPKEGVRYDVPCDPGQYAINPYQLGKQFDTDKRPINNLSEFPDSLTPHQITVYNTVAAFISSELSNQQNQCFNKNIMFMGSENSDNSFTIEICVIEVFRGLTMEVNHQAFVQTMKQLKIHRKDWKFANDSLVNIISKLSLQQ